MSNKKKKLQPRRSTLGYLEVSRYFAIAGLTCSLIYLVTNAILRFDNQSLKQEFLIPSMGIFLCLAAVFFINSARVSIKSRARFSTQADKIARYLLKPDLKAESRREILLTLKKNNEQLFSAVSKRLMFATVKENKNIL